MTGLERFLEDRRRRVEEALRGAIPPVTEPPIRLHEAMAYSLFAGGKRIRPVLVIAAAEACGSPPERVLPAACAMELIHTYSLIHDDLPCMDDDDLRRGRPTCHKAFGETLAVLAGDALQAQAFRLIATNAGVPGVPPGAAAEAALVIAEAAGSLGMVGGQAADWLAEHRTVTEDEVAFIHRKKTGALIRASVLAGAALAGGTPGQRQALGEYGEALGLLFQVTDDLLNVEGDAAALGKAVGSDAAHEKATYPAVVGVKAAHARAAALAARAREALAPLKAAGATLADLAEYVLKRTH